MLLNRYPDYMDFSGGGGNDLNYPVGRYIDIRTYLKKRYAEMFYRALPTEIADLCRQPDVHSEYAQRRSASVTVSKPFLPIIGVSTRPSVPESE